MEEGLERLLEIGKAQGHITFEQFNQCFPEECNTPERIDAVYDLLEAAMPAPEYEYAAQLRAAAAAAGLVDYWADNTHHPNPSNAWQSLMTPPRGPNGAMMPIERGSSRSE